MRKLIPLILIIIPILFVVQFGANRSDLLLSSDAGETYGEECQNEGCDVEERRELYSSYDSECIDESCQLEEVREIAGSVGAINAMLNDFQGRGWTVSGCHMWGGCVYSPGDNNASGDNAFGALCTQASINQHWADFDFDKGDWDEGFGWEDPCNINLPLGRTFNALNLLDLFGTSMPAGGTNWLPYFYAYASDEIDELDAMCDFGQANGCTSALNIRGADDYTRLFWPFFYRNDMSVPVRAGVIVHESRHAGGKGHNCTTCPNGGSCDTNWEYNGAIYYEVMYLWWLRAAGGSQVSTPLRQLARTRGNVLLGNNFCAGNPTRASAFSDPTVSNPNGTFQIP